MLRLQLRYDSYGADNGAFIEHMKTAKFKCQNCIILYIKILLVVILCFLVLEQHCMKFFQICTCKSRDVLSE